MESSTQVKQEVVHSKRAGPSVAARTENSVQNGLKFKTNRSALATRFSCSTHVCPCSNFSKDKQGAPYKYVTLWHKDLWTSFGHK